MESKDLMNFEEFCNMPEAISFEYSSYYCNKQSARRNHENCIRYYNHIRKNRRKRNKEKWKFKDFAMNYS